jgi:hypothetical protein
MEPMLLSFFFFIPVKILDFYVVVADWHIYKCCLVWVVLVNDGYALTYTSPIIRIGFRHNRGALYLRTGGSDVRSS